uniref:E3 ubiquitin-protein ligase HUWE1-like isoform X2 n=1 Tax=Styela clava TaxID=7725 RepID=UPI0019392B7D|nr:E3 ubiquitin-protein ligase HUWE1-like isoform X2 [Styela clava]
MKIDSAKAKKCVSEVPADCKALIDKLLSSDDEKLCEILNATSWWTVGKCELYHWVEVLNRFDSILQSASTQTSGSVWSLAANADENLQKLTLAVLHFTSLLIEYSFSRHLYNSMEHLVALLSSSSLDIILSVLNLLYVFSKRSNFLSRLSDKQRLPLLKKLGYLAENWGGKEYGFGLADAACDMPKTSYPKNSTTLHYEFYSEQTGEQSETNENARSMLYCIHIENVDELDSNPAEIMDSLLQMYPVPEDKRMLLYTHLRLAYSFSKRNLRLKCVQARLHAISVLVYMNSLQSVSNNLSNILYPGFIEELVDILQVNDGNIVDIKAAALRTLTSIVHLECRDRTPRVSTVVDATGVAQYHGFLPVLVRRCIQSMTDKEGKSDRSEFAPNFTTALFSFLYHLSSYESGGEALVQSGMMGPLLNVVITMGDQQEQTTFVTRAVRVIDLITNVEWQAFQRLGGLRIFIDRLEHEVGLCAKDTPPVSTQKGIQCQPQRAALFKSILNFLKKAMSYHVFGDEVRHIMDGSLPNSLKHIINNVEYYGPSLFLLAMEVVTVYVFQEPSLLSVLQDNGITDSMLNALLVKDPPATREVLASLPNIFSALCLNARGLEAFVNHKPFDRLFKVMLSPSYLLAMRIRRSSSPMDRDTASNLGNAMDELMRHQPTLRTDAMKAIIQLLHELIAMGSDPNTVCTKLPLNKPETSTSTTSTTTQESMVVEGEDTESEDEEAAATQKPAALAQTFSSTESKHPVPLLDYIHNVMKFIQAIVSNNATDDHCQEFQNHGGLPVLFTLLHLPALPMDFPSSPSCQSVANLVKSILTLSKKPQVFTDGLTDFKTILNRLEAVYKPTPVLDDEIWKVSNGSVLLYELASAPAGSEPSDIPLVQSLVHAHAFVVVLLQVCRTAQNDIRSLLISHWASEDGLDVLSRLNQLYCSLIWESTMLLSVCTPGTGIDGSVEKETEEKTKLYKILSTKYSKSTKQGKDGEQSKLKASGSSEAMEEDSKNPTAWAGCMKVIRPVLAVSSKLGRCLAELFGLLAKLSIGLPLRQRYRHSATMQSSPTKAACTVAEKLSELLNMGLGWTLPPSTSIKFRITFLTCTIGFTMGMLFDERKLSYHLMLQYFQKSGALEAFFESFNWALMVQDSENVGTSVAPELPGNLDALCETWLMVLERLVNVRNIMDTPHLIADKFSHNKNPAHTPFDPVAFLLKTHKAALDTLKKLWSSDKLRNLSARTCDSVLVILCYLIHGEKLIKRKIQKKQTTTTEPLPQDPGASSVSVIGGRFMGGPDPAPQDPTENVNFQLLVDMGFSRASVIDALLHTQTLEAATEWILGHPQQSEEDQLMQAITMSLEATRPEEEEAKKEVEVKKEDVKPVSEEQPGSSKDKEKEGYESYLSGEEIDNFVEDLLDGCLRLLDNFPDSVYRVYEVYEAIMKRNGPEWTGEKKVFENLLQDIAKSCDTILEECSSSSPVDLLEKLCSPTHKKLSSRCLLLSLLFQGRQFSDMCAEALHTSNIIPKLIQLLHHGSSCLVLENKKSLTTPEWIASVILLIDLYERSCLHKHRVDALDQFKSMNRVWKWFDDRSGRWCNYSTSNQKMLDDAYKDGVSKIVFTAGRRRYNVNFQQMVQVNEESGNRRPIMIMFSKQKPPTTSDSTETTTNTTEETSMETDVVAEKIDEKSDNKVSPWDGISQEQAQSLLHSCTALLKVPVHTDTLHAIMRLLLRLTRSDKPGGHERAVQFVKLEGPQALLGLTKRSEFAGFASLATLIFCHIFEDAETLRHTMEKTVRFAALRGVPNQSSGVSATTIGNREMYYVLQALAPMACRHPKTFVDVCKKNFRICLPGAKTSHVEDEETRLMNGSIVQILESAKDSDQHSKCRIPLSMTTKKILQLLLNGLIKSNGSRIQNHGDAAGKAHSKSASSVMSVAQQLRQVGDDMHRRYSESEADRREEERTTAMRQGSIAPVTTMEEGPSRSSQEMEEVFYPSDTPEATDMEKGSDDDKEKQEDTKQKPEEETPLFSKAAILRLLAELVSSYPACASFIVYHTYPAGISSLIKQDCSCLSFILHHLLPCVSNKKDESGGSTNNNTAKNNQNDKDCCSSLAKILLTSIVCCNPKSSIQNTVISEIKSSLHKTLVLPESQGKHNALRALLGLISTIMECATKMMHASDGGPVLLPTDDPMSLARIMISKGLGADLAQIPNYIDLGSPNMADSVNAALKPLETLSRLVHHSSAPSTPKPSGAVDKSEDQQQQQQQSSSQPPDAESLQNAVISIRVDGDSQTNREEGMDESVIESNNEGFEMAGAEASFNSVADENNESMEDTFHLVTDSEATPQFSHDLIMSESTEHDDDVVVDMNVEGDHHVNDDDDDDDQDSSGSEDRTEHNNDDQDLEDEGSEMDDLDEDDTEEEDDDDDDDSNMNRLNYETFVYDLLSETTDNNILLQLEDVLSDGFAGRMPQLAGNARTSQLFAMPVPIGDDNTTAAASGFASSWFIPTTHPMLTRAGGRTTLPGGTSASATSNAQARNTYPNSVTANRNGQTLQIEFTSNSTEAPQILTRLLGPTATADVLQLSNSLYNEGGGHAQLLVNSSNIRLLPLSRDIADSGLQNHIMSSGRNGTGSGSLSVPTAITRWTQTCEVLEPDSTQYCLLGLRQEIIDHLEERRNSDIEERRAKRAQDKEKEEKEKAAKEEAKEKDGKNKETENAENIDTPASTPDEERETQMDSGDAGISTPTNTPIATRPESPVNQQQVTTSVEVDAIDALQQASSSLQSVSLESNHDDEEHETTEVQLQDSDAGEAMQQDDEQIVETTPEENANQENQPTIADDEPSLNVIVQEPSEQEITSATDTEQQAAAAGAEAQASSANNAAQSSSEFEGVDPSFLAALPDDIRQEVIREQLSRQSTGRTSTSENQASGVSPEFLAALPPSIQQEVLAQERAEQARAAQQQSTANDPVDPTVFIQTLPSSLRQSVLADMDDSLVAVLPADLAAEAQELRATMERRQQRYFPDPRLFSRAHSNILQRTNMPSRFRYSGSGPAAWGTMPGGRNKNQNGSQSVKIQVRQLLNHDSLACLLLLLFVEEPRLNMTRLHRVLRNLCFHIPTRYWLVSTLIAILQHSQEKQEQEKEEAFTTEESMDYKTTPTTLVKQKPNLKQQHTPVTFAPDHRNTSWLSIKLDAALGSRASIFKVVKPNVPSDSGGARKKRSEKRSQSGCSVYIHPQASPVICRQTIDTLLMIAKFFPQHFVNASLHRTKSDNVSDKHQPIDTDFWDVLLKLDFLSPSSDLPKKSVAEDKRVQDLTSSDIELTCMGELLRMLAHPVLKRSQQLTDRLLRLLAQISLHLPTQSKSNIGDAGPETNKKDPEKDKEDSQNEEATTPEGKSSTATMGARACTSYTSTVGQATMDTKTATTSSTQSHGSISFPSLSHDSVATTPLEKELELAVQILTSHACSEDGLEDATTLLFHLSKTQPVLRPIIIRLLLHGAQEIGQKLCEQVITLSEEMNQYNQEHTINQQTSSALGTSSSLQPPQQPQAASAIQSQTAGASTSAASSSRYDPTQLFTLSGKVKLKRTGKELQLPIMQVLTSKTSNQAFFLRILKVIIQLRKSKKDEKQDVDQRSRISGPQGRGWTRMSAATSAIRNAFVQISQEEQDVSNQAMLNQAISSDNATNSGATTSTSGAAASSEKIEKKTEDEEDPRSLCEQLQLESLWDNLGKCLKQLEESNDPHAVLVLQPTVEAFFLVHASKQNATKSADVHKDGESQLSHLDLQPLSPSLSSEVATSQQSQSSVSNDDNLSSETKKFLDFADTHRSILNQILRQSNVPLTEGPFSVLVNHTKVLDFDVKRQHFRQELERLEENSMSRRDDIAIRVRRQHVFEDSFRELHRKSKEELKSRLYIVFEGEEGQDAGGLLREWYLIISKEIFNPMYALFRTSPGDRVTYTINPASYINSNHLSYFKFVGGIVAKAIYDNKLLDCYFTRSFYKHILGKPVRYQDMESEDYAFSQGLVYLLENDVSSFGSELNFSVEIMEFGKTETRDLKENGRDIPVEESNKKEYVHLVCQEKMTGAIRQQLSAFLEGFYEIIPKRLISIFDEQELELLISGLPTVDIEDLRNNTEYHKYETSSLQIQWFWRALRSFDQAERAKFLQFVTGTSKVPLQGFAHLEGMTGAQKFQIHRDSRSTSRLPSAHTCFNQLDLPAYETYDKLRHMLSLAINECQEGFGLA